mmetsp:Transcript_1184/g.2783  ORF Transcript_1184/g.2783 Transcript_1184/m.2783 type:complete len:295 (-) Transcript_1184:1099-1983(-)
MNDLLHDHPGKLTLARLRAGQLAIHPDLPVVGEGAQRREDPPVRALQAQGHDGDHALQVVRRVDQDGALALPDLLQHLHRMPLRGRGPPQRADRARPQRDRGEKQPARHRQARQDRVEGGEGHREVRDALAAGVLHLDGVGAQSCQDPLVKGGPVDHSDVADGLEVLQARSQTGALHDQDLTTSLRGQLAHVLPLAPKRCLTDDSRGEIHDLPSAPLPVRTWHQVVGQRACHDEVSALRLRPRDEQVVAGRQREELCGVRAEVLQGAGIEGAPPPEERVPQLRFAELALQSPPK